MDINESRKKIDSIDKELVKLFCERMDTAKDIAEYKKIIQLVLKILGFLNPIC